MDSVIEAAIDQYRQGAGALSAAIAGLDADHFDTPVAVGTWTIRAIVLHLMDADLIISGRMKCVIVEDNPPLPAFDQFEYSMKLNYRRQDPFIAAEIFEKNRFLTAAMLDGFPPATFSRVGTHSERGPVRLDQLIVDAVRHLEHHLPFIAQKRAVLERVV